MDVHNWKWVVDLTSLSAAWATVIGFLPPMAALASLIWTGIQVWEWYRAKKAGA